MSFRFICVSLFLFSMFVAGCNAAKEDFVRSTDRTKRGATEGVTEETTASMDMN